MNGPRIAVVCLLSFLFGIGTGWWAGREVFPRQWDRQERYQRMLDQFSQKLRLTPEQKIQVKAIFDAKRQKMDALRGEMRPRFEEIRRSTQEDMHKILTPEQQKIFDLMEAEWQARIKKLHPEWNH